MMSSLNWCSQPEVAPPPSAIVFFNAELALPFLLVTSVEYELIFEMLQLTQHIFGRLEERLLERQLYKSAFCYVIFTLKFLNLVVFLVT